MSCIQDLPNLGPFMARALAEIGVTSEAQLRELGPVEAFSRLQFVLQRRVSLNALWAMDAALTGTRWQDLGPERKAVLRAELASRSLQK